ncbi:MAG: response regulator [Candidatus Binataceae bacterium]|nr:response regulator [Candidatus Binataceae bacterium]
MLLFTGGAVLLGGQAPAEERIAENRTKAHSDAGGGVAAIEHELLGARDALSAQIAALRESQRQLQTEIARHQQMAAEREQAEARARNSEITLRRIFDASPDAMSARRLRDRVIIECNPEYLRLTGYRREDVIGRTSVALGLWRPAQEQRFFALLQRQGFVRNWSDNFPMPDGTVVPMLISAVIADLGGERCAIMTGRDIRELKTAERELIAAREALSAQVRTLRDTELRLRAEIEQREQIIAERRRAQKKVAESETTLRKIFDTSIDAISIRRLRDSSYIDANHAFTVLSGFHRSELIGRSLDELNLRADNLKLAFLNSLVSKGYVRNMEGRLRRKDGSIVPIMTSGVLIELDGEPCVAAITRDITQSKKIESELISAREAALAASSAKSEFLSSMSHEIRTPMTAILGMADLLWETPLTLHQRRYLETMRTNGDALLALINDILDLAKVESGQLVLEKANFELDQLIEKVIETFATRAHEKGLELSARISPEVELELNGDPLRLRQILINLLSNAVKFTRAGEVLLTVEHDPAPPRSADRPGSRWFQFSVADTGIGIPEEKISAIFSSFTQADSSITRQFGGTGLGLAIVKRLVEFHGGRISVDSRITTGSTFRFSIPLTVRSSQHRAITPGKTALAGYRVLVADDTGINRQVIREVLAPQGASVDEAASGEQALEIIEQAHRSGQAYDLILLDSRMPTINGFEVAAKLRRNSIGNSAISNLTRSIVLMLASDDLATSLEQINELGLARYIVKPIRPHDLLEAAAVITDPVAAHIVPSAAPILEQHNAAAAPLKVLLAEDSVDNRMLIKTYLKGGGYQVEEAENGKVAIEKFIAGKFDVALMDIQMPLVDGYTAVRAIRQWEHKRQLSRLPIIALTASAMDEAVHRSLQAGCDSHVSKPVNRATLIEAIREAISRAPASGGAPPGEAADPAAASAALNMAKLVTPVDAALIDLMPEFLARKREDTVAIESAVNRLDFETMRLLGHRIKGEGSSYGLETISEIGAALEDAGHRHDGPSARKLANALTNYLARVTVTPRAAAD